MTDLERIARAIWADRAARILAEDIAGKTEEGSAGKLTYDELGEGFQRGLMSEARAAIMCIREPSDQMASAAEEIEIDDSNLRAVFTAMCDAILNSENAPASP